MDNPDSIRGEQFDLVILDEAASMAAGVWTEAIMPTLADRDGSALIIGTPKGRNWFFEEFARGLADGEYQASWTAPTRANPSPRIRKASERARQILAPPTYLQEWEAQFLEGEGLVFRRVAEAATTPWPANGSAGVVAYAGQFVMGVDWGRTGDYTVLVVIDVRRRAVVDIDRYNQIGWALQRGRLVELWRKWLCVAILAEENSIGHVNIEALQQGDPANGIPPLPVQGFMTTNASKTAVIEELVLDIENSRLTYPQHPVLLAELQAFEMSRLPSGLIRYAAPSGIHDDMVIALALARRAMGTTPQAIQVQSYPTALAGYRPR
jgi:hypothetical protein